MRTSGARRYNVIGARSVLGAISQSNGLPRERPKFRFIAAKRPRECEERPTCPICHLSKSCECTADDRHFYELAQGKVLPGESIEHAVWRTRNEYNAQFAQQTLETLEEPEDNRAHTRKHH